MMDTKVAHHRKSPAISLLPSRQEHAKVDMSIPHRANLCRIGLSLTPSCEALLSQRRSMKSLCALADTSSPAILSRIDTHSIAACRICSFHATVPLYSLQSVLQHFPQRNLHSFVCKAGLARHSFYQIQAYTRAESCCCGCIDT